MELTPDRVALINHLLDFIMANVQQNVTTLKNYQKVPVQDLVKKLDLDLTLTTLTASLRASQGSLSDLTTIRRVGDVALTSEGNTIYIALTITLDVLELDFDKYTLQLSMIKISGNKLKLSIKKNLFDLFLVLRFNGLEVEMYFDRFKLIKFSDIDVDITGFGMLNPVARKVADWVVDYFNNFIVKEVAEPYAKNLFNSAISDKDFLRRLFGYAISGMVRGASSNRSPQTTNSADTQSPSTTPEEPPVAPVRQRRNAPRPQSEGRRNNLAQPNPPLGSRTSTPRQNNIKLQTGVFQNSTNSVNSRTPEVTVKNNLTPRKNEIFIEPRKMFSPRPPTVVDVDHIFPLKPPIL